MRSWLTYIAAFIAGLCGAYVIARAAAAIMFDQPPAIGIVLTVVVQPLAGIAAFALVYRIVDGHRFKARFWLSAFGLVGAICATGLLMIYSGATTVIQAAALAMLALFFLGRFFMGRGARA